MVQTKQGGRITRSPGWPPGQGGAGGLRRVWATSQAFTGVASTI